MAGALGAFQGQWGTNIPLLSRGLAADPDADDRHLLRLPAPVHLRAARRARPQGAETQRWRCAYPDKWVWDFWFAATSGDHHIFYLQAPRTLGARSCATTTRRSATQSRRPPHLADAARRAPPGPGGQLGRPRDLDRQRDRARRPLAHALHGDHRADEGLVQRDRPRESPTTSPLGQASRRTPCSRRTRAGTSCWTGALARAVLAGPMALPRPDDGHVPRLITARSLAERADGARRGRSCAVARPREWEVLLPLTEPEIRAGRAPQLVRIAGLPRRSRLVAGRGPLARAD